MDDCDAKGIAVLVLDKKPQLDKDEPLARGDRPEDRRRRAGAANRGRNSHEAPKPWRSPSMSQDPNESCRGTTRVRAAVDAGYQSRVCCLEMA